MMQEAETVDEQQWLACGDHRVMLELLRSSGRLSARKLRLFACALVRRVWDDVVDEQSHKAVEAEERFADGIDPNGGFEAAAFAVRSLMVGTFYACYKPGAPPFVSVGSRVSPDTVVGYGEAMMIFNELTADCSGVVVEVLVNTGDLMEYGTVLFRVVRTTSAKDPEGPREAPVHMVHDLFGNPFRPLPPPASSVLQWNGGLVRRLAKEAYERRTLPAGTLDNARLAILADALEEAGADDADVLSHLRGPGRHCLGCWSVDWVLGRS